MSSRKLKIAFISPYPYKFDALSIFTKNLIWSLQSRFSWFEPKVFLLSASDLKHEPLISQAHSITRRVEIDNIQSLIEAAEQINKSEVALVNFQLVGDFFIREKNYLKNFIEMINKPIVITLHEKIRKNNLFCWLALKELAENKNILFSVMSKKTKQCLISDFGVSQGRIKIIPQGSLFLPPEPKEQNCIHNQFRNKLGLKKKSIILSTAGFVTPRKGQIYVIKALPKILSQFPNLVYIIWGSTKAVDYTPIGSKKASVWHYTYFLRCKNLAKKLGVDKNIIFKNKFLSSREFKNLLIASDIYLVPSTDREQLSSATLAYALGLGKAVIATRTFISEELIINNQNGILVPIRNPAAIAQAIFTLIKNPSLKKKLGDNAKKKAINWYWPNLADDYMNLFQGAIKSFKRGERVIPVFFSHPIGLRMFLKEMLSKRKIPSFFSILNSKAILYTPFYPPSLGLKKFTNFEKSWRKIEKSFLLIQCRIVKKIARLV